MDLHLSRIIWNVKDQPYDRTYFDLPGPWTQEKTHMIEEKEVKILHPITYMSGLFRGSQMN